MSNAMRTQLKLISSKCFFNFKTNPINNCKQFWCSIAFRSFSLQSNRCQKSKAVAERQTSGQTELTVGERVKQTTKDISYFGNDYN